MTMEPSSCGICGREGRMDYWWRGMKWGGVVERDEMGGSGGEG